MLIFIPPETYKRLRYPEPKPKIRYLSGIFQIIEYGYFQSKFFTSNDRVRKIQKNEKWLEGL